MEEIGYIYCISNLEVMPGIYKVGVTLRSPLDRLKEANSSDTWKIPSYKIEFAKRVNNPKEKEKTLHKLMEKFMSRVHPRREFFRGELSDIKEAFKLMDGTIWNEERRPENNYHEISIEERLSEDPDIRLNQLIEIVNIVFSKNNIKINERGTSGHSHYPIYIDNTPLLIIENHDIGRGKRAMFTTTSLSYNKYPKIKEYYNTLNWDSYGNGYSRKQYDTEGKTKQEIIDVLNGFKNLIDKINEPNKENNVSKLDIKKIIWSNDENSELKDRFNNIYSFDKPWKFSKYIKTIKKNGEPFSVSSGIHRGYCIWLDSNDITHISHGHQNIKKIGHCIFDDNTITTDWLCNWGKFKEEDIKMIHNHFGISNI